MTKVLFKRKTSDEIATLPVEDGALIYNYETGATYLDYDDERIPTGGGMPTGDTFPIGAITSYAGSTAPTNWLICDGRAISRVTYADLFNAIGTTYGAGDGSTTFNLPNLKGKIPIGKDTTQNEFDTLGETGGEKIHTLTVDEMPSHKHNGIFEYYSEREISNRSDAGGGGHDINYSSFDGSMDNSYSYLYTADAGGGQAHNNLQPYIVLNYIIKAFQSAGTVANVSAITTSSDTDTYSCNYINQNNTYSTSEIKTNKVWIDDKPIYRKVISVNSPASADVYTTIANMGSNVVDTLVSATSMILANYDANNQIFYNLNIDESDANHYCLIAYNRGNGNIQAKVGTEFINKNITIVLEYTKTTDT